MRIVVLVGLPGSGKSTWLRDRGLRALSSDETRVLLTNDVTHQGVNRLIFSTMRALCVGRIKAGCDVTYIDSTALSRWERRCWIQLAELYGCDVECVFFDVPLDVCKQRNASRDRVVPDDAMDRMAAKLVTPQLEEGFGRITVVR